MPKPIQVNEGGIFQRLIRLTPKRAYKHTFEYRKKRATKFFFFKILPVLFLITLMLAVNKYVEMTKGNENYVTITEAAASTRALIIDQTPAAVLTHWASGGQRITKVGLERRFR